MKMTDTNKPYRYFDTPDGQDVFKKLGCIMPPLLKTAAMAGTTNIMMISHPKGYMATLGKFTHIAWPIVATGTTFVVASNAAAGVRGKDGMLNWFIGGFTSGTIWGVWAKNRRVVVGFHMGMILGFAALFRKYAQIRGWDLIPVDNIVRESMTISNYDWTLTAERPRNWVSSNQQE